MDGEEVYPRIADLIGGARSVLRLSFRILDPDTGVRGAVRDGGQTWGAMLAEAAARGAEVYVHLTDFEPIGAPGLHQTAWRSFHRLVAYREDLDEDARARFHVMCCLHEGRLGMPLRVLLWLEARRRLRRASAELNDMAREAAEEIHALRPGHWPYVRRRGEGPYQTRVLRPPFLFPATHHHKLIVADDERAVIGGLDIDERRYDDPRHDRPAAETWHDVSVEVEGPVARDIARHAAVTWNRDFHRFLALNRLWGRDHALRNIRRLVGRVRAQPLPEAGSAPQPGPIPAQLLRTASRRFRRPFAFGPKPLVRDLERAHRRLIMGAERLLYIEAQFFRLVEVADWIGRAARRSPGLHVILVLPMAPEEVAFDGKKDSAQRHGEWLQWKAVSRLRDRLGDRVGLFAPVLRRPDPDARERARAYGSGIVYVHAKVVLADDIHGLVSSANINGRSFRWDTEAGVLWRDPDTVAGLRRKLWRGWIGDEMPDAASDPAGALARWRTLAEANAELPPEERTGFMVPYATGRARRFARWRPVFPTDML